MLNAKELNEKRELQQNSSFNKNSILIFYLLFIWGGEDLLGAEDLSQYATCNSANKTCVIDKIKLDYQSKPDSMSFTIDSTYNKYSITNNVKITTNVGSTDSRFTFQTDLNSFTNNNEINGGGSNHITIKIENSTINYFINNGKIINDNSNGNGNVIQTDNNSKIEHLINLGTIKGYLSINGNYIGIDKYKITLNKDANTFNNTSSGYDDSHLVYTANSNGYLKLNNNKAIILDFGNNFELNKDYLLNKLIVNSNNSTDGIKDSSNNNISTNNLFNYLTSSSPIYTLQRGDTSNSFRVNIDGLNSAGNTIYKSNISNINNLLFKSNFVIFNAKTKSYKGNFALNNSNKIESNPKYLAYKFRENGRFYYKNSINYDMDTNIKSNNNLNSNNAESETLESNSFNNTNNITNTILSDNASNNLVNKTPIPLLLVDNIKTNTKKENRVRRARVNELNTRELNTNSNKINNELSKNYEINTRIKTEAQNQINIPNRYNTNNLNNITQTNNNFRNIQTQSSSDKYHFFFSPFISHNMFYNDGLNYSGLDYGFISGFNAKLGNLNTLGVHLGFSYGSLSESEFSTNLNTINIMAGLHYKLDLAYDIFVKLRGDVFYFLNDMSYAGLKQSPKNFGFGASGYFGKDFDFKRNGILTLEIGANYNGLQNEAINFGNEIYNKNLLLLGYINLGLNYSNSFSNGFGFDLGLGGNVLLTKPIANIILLNNNIEYSIGIDRFSGYANVGVNYAINDIVELGLEYLGSFGDKSISNSGFFNVRVWW
ncbi:MAG: autotransporter outer membrane beta-barrel domain-containing protein [Helicobacteraceae bacterium]|nr:autotransporter outer membrane beta-barrel domain-containing protein [Helicobacteraceae bacterium]